MYLTTEYLPLAAWVRLIARIDQAIADADARMRPFVTASRVTLDSCDAVLANGAQARGEFAETFRLWQGLWFARVQLIEEIERHKLYNGITRIEATLDGYHKMGVLYSELQPLMSSRMQAEHTLAQLQAAYATVRSASSPQASVERQHLRTAEVSLPCVGSEDVQPFVLAEQLRQLVTKTEKELEARLAAVKFNLVIYEYQVDVFRRLGIDTVELPAPDEQLASGSEDRPTDPDSAFAGNSPEARVVEVGSVGEPPDVA